MTRFNTTLLALLCAGGTAAQAQLEPGAGAWPTWVLSSGAQFRPAAPPSDAASAAELSWLKAFNGGADDSAKAQIAYWAAGSPGYRWMKIASQEMLAHNLQPAFYTRGMALLSVAIYDATVAAWDGKYAWNRPRPSAREATLKPLADVPLSPSYPSDYAATAGAAAAVLSYLFPDEAGAFSSLEAEAARSRLFAATEYPSDSVSGLQLGRAVGAAVVAYARQDGSDALFTGAYPPAPGKWSNPAPTTPLAGTWKPWVLSSGAQLRLPAPAAVDSSEYAAQLALVKSLTRDNNVQHSAWFWQPSFVTPWLDTLYTEIFQAGWAANPPRAARAFALATVAQHDATIACWDTKFAYLEPRPSQVDPSVATLFANPAHPGFPSGHACASGASAAVTGYLFPADSIGLADQALDAGLSTFYAGIHTRFDVQQGFALGQAVGNAVVARAAGGGPQ